MYQEHATQGVRVRMCEEWTSGKKIDRYKQPMVVTTSFLSQLELTGLNAYYYGSDI